MENHLCLSLSKCVNDKVKYKHRRLRGKSKMDLVGNPEDRFSHNQAQRLMIRSDFRQAFLVLSCGGSNDTNTVFF